jgi:8-oxo-dGTP pyrophosphatase MutT (NUDIX family)
VLILQHNKKTLSNFLIIGLNNYHFTFVEPGMNYVGAGFVLLSSDLTSVLLICDTRSGKWGFTKGHRESYDASDCATAEREIFEETGLRPYQYVVIPESFKIKKGAGSYIFRYAILKESEYNTYLHPGPSYEVKALAWFPLRELLDATHILDANVYLRTWIQDLQNGYKRDALLYKSLLAFQPSQISVSTCNIITSS